MAQKRIVLDTSVLVGDLLRRIGRERLKDPRLELLLPEQMARETEVELPRRIAIVARRRRWSDVVRNTLENDCFEVLRTTVRTTQALAYGSAEEEARARCLRDPDDWPVVATALLTGGEIWTNDNDFLGVGIATWTTDTLQGWLDRNP